MKPRFRWVFFQAKSSTPKISNRLFNKSKKVKRRKDGEESAKEKVVKKEEEEEVVDDGPSVFKVKPDKKPEKGSGTGNGKGKRGKRGGIAKDRYQLTNTEGGYDSDSVDLDLLSTYNR